MNSSEEVVRSISMRSLFGRLLILVCPILLALDPLDSILLGDNRLSQWLGLSFCVAIFFTFALVFLLGSKKATNATLRLVVVVCMVEAALQIMAMLQLLPLVSDCDHVPFGRVYWNLEARNASIMNRFGWHYSEFDLREKGRRVILIGDSYIEAVQVPVKNHLARHLERLLNTPGSVIPLGLPGIGPAHYLELFEYSIRHYQPHDVVFFVYLGNDIDDLSEKLAPRSPNRYLYYALDGADSIRLRPESLDALRVFHNKLESNHRHLMWSFAHTARSYIMTYKVLLALAHPLVGQRHGEDRPGRPDEKEIVQAGLNVGAFEKQVSGPYAEACQILQNLLAKSKQIADIHGVRIMVVTIPAFPKFFFRKFEGTDYTFEFDQWDLLALEKLVRQSCDDVGVSCLAMGDYMARKRISTQEIRSLYFNEGPGHFTDKGHAFFARAVFDVLKQ